MQSEGKPKYFLPNWFRNLKRTTIKEHFRPKQNEKIRTLMLNKNDLVPTKRVYDKKVLSAYILPPVVGLSVGSSNFTLFSCFFFPPKVALKNVRTTFRYTLSVSKESKQLWQQFDQWKNCMCIEFERYVFNFYLCSLVVSFILLFLVKTMLSYYLNQRWRI